MDDTLFIMGDLPDPLSREELKLLFVKCKNGDMGAREKIITHNIRFVIYYVIRKFDNIRYSKKDLISLGLYGLMKAVDTIDMARVNLFLGYVARCIDNEILMFLRKEKKHDQISLNMEIVVDGSLFFEDMLCNETDIALELDYESDMLFINDLIELMPDLDKQIMTLYFGLNNNMKCDQTEIASLVNMSQSAISRRIKNNLQFLRNKLGVSNQKVKKRVKKC